MKSGRNVVIVVEIPSELDTILAIASELGLRPNLGLRYRLSKPGTGRWSSSNGQNGLFGLGVRELVRAIDQLREADCLSCLQMLHFHQGSQLYDLNGIRSGVREAARVYADLTNEGAAMGALNLGGGLAIDYDGTRTAAQSSKNYSVSQYCDALVRETAEVLDGCGVSHPTLITESGRGVSAHASALVFEVFDAGSNSMGSSPISIPDDAPDRVYEIRDEIVHSAQINPSELVTKPNLWRQELHDRFARGELRLRDLAAIDEAFEAACDSHLIPAEQLGVLPPTILYGNFSIFQSLPDHWALGQTFPILPIHRLDECPEQNAVLADLTCDSDGKIRTYISSDEAQSLPVHKINRNESYFFGAFLTGAYQEILGDKHNLFGSPPVIDVEIRDGQVVAAPASSPESVEEILKSIGFDATTITDVIGANAAATLGKRDAELLVDSLAETLKNSSYLRSPTLGV
jgi:arginine decarboxylase